MRNAVATFGGGEGGWGWDEDDDYEYEPMPEHTPRGGGYPNLRRGRGRKVRNTRDGLVKKTPPEAPSR